MTAALARRDNDRELTIVRIVDAPAQVFETVKDDCARSLLEQ